jgi:hypothetical protein
MLSPGRKTPRTPRASLWARARRSSQHPSKKRVGRTPSGPKTACSECWVRRRENVFYKCARRLLLIFLSLLSRLLPYENVLTRRRLTSFEGFWALASDALSPPDVIQLAEDLGIVRYARIVHYGPSANDARMHVQQAHTKAHVLARDMLFSGSPAYLFCRLSPLCSCSFCYLSLSCSLLLISLTHA